MPRRRTSEKRTLTRAIDDQVAAMRRRARNERIRAGTLRSFRAVTIPQKPKVLDKRACRGAVRLDEED